MMIVPSLSVLKKLVPYWETVSILASYPVSLQDCFSDSNTVGSKYEIVFILWTIQSTNCEISSSWDRWAWLKIRQLINFLNLKQQVKCSLIKVRLQIDTFPHYFHNMIFTCFTFTFTFTFTFIQQVAQFRFPQSIFGLIVTRNPSHVTFTDPHFPIFNEENAHTLPTK